MNYYGEIQNSQINVFIKITILPLLNIIQYFKIENVKDIILKCLKITTNYIYYIYTYIQSS